MPRERRSIRSSSAVLASAVALLSGGAAEASALSSPVIPAGLEARTLASDLSEPTAVAFAPDGRIFIAEKRGVVRVVLPSEAPRSRRLIDITSRTATVSDRGLLGVAVDSDFSSNGYLYVLYTHDGNPSDSFGPKVGRLSRFKVGRGATLIGGERPILGTANLSSCPTPGPTVDCIPIDGRSHGIGTVRSAADGTLWVGVGDGVQWDTLTPTLGRALDPNVMSGAILHVDRNGLGLPGHPFCPAERDLTRSCTKVHAKGFRNPFRFQLLPSGKVAVGDVGGGLFEEVNIAEAGGSYGWPCFEGAVAHPVYSGTPWCASVAAQAQPFFAYPRGEDGAAVILGPLMPVSWPDPFGGRLAYSDYVSQSLNLLDLGKPEATPAVLGGLGEIVDLELTPRNGLALVEAPHDQATIGLPNGRIWALYPAGASQRPWPAPSATVAGTSVTFAANVLDTDTPAGELSFRWSFGDGGTSRASRPVHRYRRPGTFTATLTVSDGTESATAAIRVTTGVALPAIAILAPANGQLGTAGTTVAVEGRATLNGKPLPASSLAWRISLRHNTHSHDWAAFYGSRGSFRTATDHDADSSYLVTLRATADSGATSSRTIELKLKTRLLDLGTNVPGLKVGWGEGAWSGARTTAVGFRSMATVPAVFADSAGRRWRFERWSDGSTSASRWFTMPDSDATLRAIYSPAGA